MLELDHDQVVALERGDVAPLDLALHLVTLGHEVVADRGIEVCLTYLCSHVRPYRGKMLRPALLLFSAEACGGITDEHLILAAVVELIHMATLVHDDVLDEAELRRKCPTINCLRGNEAAVHIPRNGRMFGPRRVGADRFFAVPVTLDLQPLFVELAASVAMVHVVGIILLKGFE